MLDRFTWFRQSAFRWTDGNRVVYIDPWGTEADAPPADLILITHAHFDHFQPEEIDRLRREGTAVVAPRDVAVELGGDVTAVVPGETHEVGGFHLETVPAYNTREEALDFHPKANKWIGYIIDLGEYTYYHAGDTDHLPELDSVKTDVAFLPVGGHYTMDALEAAGLAKAIGPKLAVPIHFGFVVGSPSEGRRFRDAAAPVPVEIMSPEQPFEMEES
jgi:L-ascorbate metabolism protein UlaG (beta-lactamase superfamily)